VVSTLRVSTAAYATPDGRAAVAAVVRTPEADRPRIVARRLRRGDGAPPAYRALLVALWDARRAGARRLVVSTDDPDVAAHLAGQAPPPVEAVGAYVQVRALLHAFAFAEVRYLAREHNFEAVAAAAAAVGHRQPACADLPLWRAAS
jgi:hypothetical protein